MECGVSQHVCIGSLEWSVVSQHVGIGSFRWSVG